MRAQAVDPLHRFETVLGTLGFDTNGDSIQQFVTIFRVDPQAADGAGDWVVVKQQDYGVTAQGVGSGSLRQARMGHPRAPSSV